MAVMYHGLEINATNGFADRKVFTRCSIILNVEASWYVLQSLLKALDTTMTFSSNHPFARE
jgi:hypothetical protein